MHKHPERTHEMLILRLLLILLPALLPAAGNAADAEFPARIDIHDGLFSVSMRDVPLAEAAELLSRRGRRNIIVADGIDGTVSVNLFDVSVDQAVRIIAEGAGQTVELRDGTYYIIKRNDAGKYAEAGHTIVRPFGIQYSDVNVVSNIVKEALSHWGSVTVLADRGVLVVKDRPEFVNRIAELVRAVDREPQQVLIEARILEISLDDAQSAGIDWSSVVTTSSNDLPGEGLGSVGTRQLAAGGGPGLFFEFLTPRLDITLDALESKGRVRTLSTPTLLALENEESHVIIGDRLGYRVTTTINQITTESIEFLESGVILRVTPSVDSEGRVLMTIHPQVSTGVIQNGIPSLSTTEVTTTLLIPSGQTTFIGGLLRQGITESRDGVPFLSDLPLLGALFSAESKTNLRTETVALITPYVLGAGGIPPDNAQQIRKAEEAAQIMDHESERIEDLVDESRSGWLDPANPTRAALGEDGDEDTAAQAQQGPGLPAGTSGEPQPANRPAAGWTRPTPPTRH